MQVISSQEAYGLIRNIAPFRLVGSTRDYLLVASDSGRIVILEFDATQNAFKKVHQETYGKTGCRRIIAGEYIAIDPNGRACMVAAVEKQKFVYILNRDLDQNLTISSPLEAHKANTILYSLVALDVGFENPLFATIEASYDGIGTKMLTIYEMDLGINHVVRKYAEPLPGSAHLLIPVPGGSDGPGGCLICCDGSLIYKRLGRETLTCTLPRRVDCPLDASVMITAHTRHRMKDFSLIMIQSELGDLFRVDLVVKGPANGPVEALRIAYMDTIPRAVSLCILKSGFLFSASEFGPHSLYQFKASQLLTKDMEGVEILNSSNSDTECSPFRPKPTEGMETLEQPIHETASLCPITDSLPIYDSEKELRILVGSGKSVRALKLGVPVQELAATCLPGKPSGIWTLMDKLIIISFIDATLVLAVGETVQEISDSGILGTVQTVGVGVMADGSLVQVHLRGVRQVNEQTGRVTEWRVPGGRQVVSCSVNSRQILLGLTAGELVYLEVSTETNTIEEVFKRDMGCEILALSVPLIPEGRSRAFFSAIGGSDRSVRILSLEPDKLLRQISAQSFQGASVESLVITNDGFLSVGLGNGTLVRCALDKVTGLLSDSRARFVGLRPARLTRLPTANKQEAVLVMSSRPWIVDPSTVGLVPLVYQNEQLSMTVFEFAAPFNSELCPDGLVVIVEGSLRIVSGLDRLGTSAFAEHRVDSNYTVRKLVRVPNIVAGMAEEAVAVIETEKDSLPVEERMQLFGEDSGVLGSMSVSGKGRWASCVRLLNPLTLETRAMIDMDTRNEAAVAATCVRFYQLKDSRPCLVVATAVNQQITPKRKAEKLLLKTYLYDDQFVPKLVHTTSVENGGVVLAMAEFEGRLLVSFSPNSKGIAILRLYELGKKQLLKKSEYRNFQCGGFTNIQIVKDRIFVSDTHQSVHVLKLNKVDGQMFVIADDMLQRYMSSMLLLDYNTVVGADKFDNIFVSRVPAEVREEQVGESSLRLGPDTNYILGKSHKLELVNQFHLGELVTSMHKVALAPGASEVILYTTLNGSIGILYPFTSKKEYELFLSSESNLRGSSSLIGRDHAAFRGYYLPAKGVVDGDLIAELRSRGDKAEIAKIVGLSVSELEKAIEEIRNRIT
jgi:splicing factor 3B subunit 3